MDSLTILPYFSARTLPSGFSEEAGAPGTALLPDTHRWQQRPARQGPWGMWFEFKYFFMWVFSLSSLHHYTPLPPLMSRRYSWTFQPGKEEFLNIMDNGQKQEVEGRG